MSYESKIIIAKKYESFNEEGKQLAVELATFNLGAALWILKSIIAKTEKPVKRSNRPKQSAQRAKYDKYIKYISM